MTAICEPLKGGRRGGMVAGLILAGVTLAAAWLPAPAQESPKTHWAPYRNLNRPPSVNQDLQDPILVGAIDLHAHHGPDSYPRQWDAFEVAELAAGRGMRAVLLKNHWTETAGLAYLVAQYGARNIEVFGSVTLDTPVGGVNPQAVRYMVDVTGGRGRVVWMPTHDSEHEVRFNNEDRPFVRVSQDGQLLPEVLEVIGLIAEHDLTLATGHVTPEETFMIMAEAGRQGVERIIVTHPIMHAQYTLLDTVQLQRAVELNGYIEITASSFLGGDAGRARALAAIRAVGVERSFISSDSGLIGTPNHPDSLAMAARILREEGFSEADLKVLFQDNPAQLLGLPVQ